MGKISHGEILVERIEVLKIRTLNEGLTPVRVEMSPLTYETIVAYAWTLFGPTAMPSAAIDFLTSWCGLAVEIDPLLDGHALAVLPSTMDCFMHRDAVRNVHL